MVVPFEETIWPLVEFGGNAESVVLETTGVLGNVALVAVVVLKELKGVEDAVGENAWLSLMVVLIGDTVSLAFG